MDSSAYNIKQLEYNAKKFVCLLAVEFIKFESIYYGPAMIQKRNECPKWHTDDFHASRKPLPVPVHSIHVCMYLCVRMCLYIFVQEQNDPQYTQADSGFKY